MLKVATILKKCSNARKRVNKNESGYTCIQTDIMHVSNSPSAFSYYYQ